MRQVEPVSPASRVEQIRKRRRVVLRIGFLMLVAASATACIFDQSDYKGGGRLDKGATAKPPPEDAEPPPRSTTTSPSNKPDTSIPTTD